MAILQMLDHLNRWTIVYTVLVLATCIAYFRPRKLAGNEPPLIHPKNGIPFIGHLIGLLRNGFPVLSAGGVGIRR